jgi:prophage regulatory protein
MSSDEILRRPAVIKKTGLPTSTLYAKIVAGEFPKPVNIGERSVGWFAGEVDAWLEQRRAERDAKLAQQP